MERYQFTAKIGDIVRLKNGNLAVIATSEILCAGHAREITVVPFVNPIKRFLSFVLCRHRFLDAEINSLEKVGSLLQAA